MTEQTLINRIRQAPLNLNDFSSQAKKIISEIALINQIVDGNYFLSFDAAILPIIDKLQSEANCAGDIEILKKRLITPVRKIINPVFRLEIFGDKSVCLIKNSKVPEFRFCENIYLYIAGEKESLLQYKADILNGHKTFEKYVSEIEKYGISFLVKEGEELKIVYSLKFQQEFFKSISAESTISILPRNYQPRQQSLHS